MLLLKTKQTAISFTHYLEKELFSQKLLITRETFKKTLSANLKPKKANPKVKISRCMYTKFVCK